MKKEQILEGNELIAKFMGGKFTLVRSHTPNVEFKKHPRQDRNFNSLSMHPKLLSYHKSFDWLMPVVEKIETIQLPTPSMIPVRIKIAGNSCRIFKGEWNDNPEGFISYVSYYGNEQQYSKREAIYLAVIDFIKFYNKKT